jgi:predicted RNA-binding Zn-ribbon protein involved in translation (DUF1610 family)
MQQDNYNGLKSCTVCGIRLMIPTFMLGQCAQCPQCGRHFIAKDGDASRAESEELERRIETALNRARRASSTVDCSIAAAEETDSQSTQFPVSPWGREHCSMTRT